MVRTMRIFIVNVNQMLAILHWYIGQEMVKRLVILDPEGKN